jgi:peptidoglycan/xylan/chitin deacetylase (PgdA/CDA1 family)
LQQCNDNNDEESRGLFNAFFCSVTHMIKMLLCLAVSLTLPAFSDQQAVAEVGPEAVAAPVPSHAVILLYHHVSNDTPAVTSISPQRFEQQLQFIEDNQFDVWPLDKIILYLDNGIKLPDKVIAITFDDSYRSVFTQAFPRLKKRHWPFTIFVSTQSVDQQFSSQTHWQQLREMAENGATIANHSTGHEHLLMHKKDESPQQWASRIKHNILTAGRRIEREIGIKNSLFAYPYGEFNQDLKNIVAQLDMVGFGQQSGAIGPGSDRLALARFPIAGNYTNIKDFAIKLMTLPMPVIQMEAPENPLPHNHSKPELTLEFKSEQFSKNLQCFGSGQGRLSIQWHKNKPHRATISPNKEIPVGRSRFNCTLTGPNNRFYWYSHSWIRLNPINQWKSD